MERQLILGDKKASISANKIVLDGFHLSPAEVNKLKGLLGLCGSMAGLRSLPPEISDPPFRIEFKENGAHHIYRTDSNAYLVFKFSEISNLIDDLEKCLNTSLDITRLNPRQVGTTDLTSGAPDIIEGR